LEAFGRRPRCEPNRRHGPSSETLHNSGSGRQELSRDGAWSRAPPETVEILNKAVGEALKDPKVTVRLSDPGGPPMTMIPAEFGKLIADKIEK
jgi:hypothetical protein